MASSREEGVKPSRIRAGINGAYSNHRPRRLARMSMRLAVSREWNWEVRGVEGGGLKG